MMVECGDCGKDFYIPDYWVFNQSDYNGKLHCPYCKVKEEKS